MVDICFLLICFGMMGIAKGDGLPHQSADWLAMTIVYLGEAPIIVGRFRGLVGGVMTPPYSSCAVF